MTQYGCQMDNRLKILMTYLKTVQCW